MFFASNANKEAQTNIQPEVGQVRRRLHPKQMRFPCSKSTNSPVEMNGNSDSPLRSYYMVNTCANPECRKILRYLRDGVVYLFSNQQTSDAKAKTLQPTEHFWLCGSCAERWILKPDTESRVRLVQKSLRKNSVPVTETNTALPYAM